MMRHLLIGLALAGAPTAALACQCDDPADFSAAEQQERAAWIAKQDFVVAEVERLDSNVGNAPIRYKVIKPLIGSAPSEIVIAPDAYGAHSSCDYWGTPGRRQIMAFGSSPLVSGPKCGVLARINEIGLYPAGMCIQYSVQTPGMVERIRQALRAPTRR